MVEQRKKILGEPLCKELKKKKKILNEVYVKKHNFLRARLDMRSLVPGFKNFVFGNVWTHPSILLRSDSVPPFAFANT